MNSFEIYQIVVIAAGAYCIFRGIMTLLTGKLPEREEVRIKEYSENGMKKYKLLSSLLNIFGGIVVVAGAVLRILNLLDLNLYRILLLVIVAVMVVVYILIRNTCTKTK